MVNNTSNRIIACTYGRGNWWAEYYTPCSTIGTLLVSGNLTGYRFYEYQSIASTSTITAGEGTNVLMKGLDYVQLNPGFEAKAGNLFKGYIGPCGNGGVQFVPTLNDDLPMEGAFIAAENGQRWPYAHFKNVNNLTANVTINVQTPGEYSFRIADESGIVLAIPFKDRAFSKGDHVYSYQTFLPTKTGMYYLQLLKGLQLVNFHEMEVSK